ncbi:MAG: sigma 54-interacting transcriptional regulator [Desulfobacter sp.]|nr:MAG: sigma 54-interacting transcriptional regulator [Desulfobacter sp.]
MKLKLRLRYKDRIGIVADVSQIVAASGLNIVFMEVVRKDDTAVVFMEIEGRLLQDELDTVIEGLKGTANFQEVNLIDTLPQEEREDRFRVVLDNISDGVISIDREGRITTINKVAAQVYNLSPDQVIGRNIRDIDLPQYAILESLEGQSLKNVKQNLITSQGRYQYISTCRPLRDSSGMIVGAVEIAKDMHEIKKMAKSFSEPAQIGFSDIIGKNSVIKAAITFAQKVAVTGAPIAIRGASGTGKELFARAIHTASRRSGSFVPINCAALPDPLLESELFGYESGTFTGGKKEGKAGLFETAREGTVFLDEIADMSLASQAKLLRLIQEGAVRRVGGSKEIPINARIITATNKNLEQRVEDKKFRKDLYYRISVLPIHIPPLSQRLDDIPLLVEHFLFTLTSRLEKQMPGLTASAYDKLKQHLWPGNIRELKNVVERAAILSEGRSIDVDSILFSHEMPHSAIPMNHSPALTQSSLKSQVGELEKKIIVSALKTHHTIRQAARVLQISHPALLNKMKKYKIRKTTRIRS